MNAENSLLSKRGVRASIEWVAAIAVIVTCLRIFLTDAFLARPPIADRGTYILYGKLIAEGSVMYRDIWDSKPPMIDLLGALAWWLAPRVEAVLAMERVALLFLGGTMFAMLRYGLGIRSVPALCGLVVGLIALRNPDVFSGGHLTEEYGILFEMAVVTCVGLSLRVGPRETSTLWTFGAGAFAALTILTRQTFLAALSAIWLAAHAPLVRTPRRLLSVLAWELAGFAVPTALWFSYLWWTGSFAAFLELIPETFAFASAPLNWQTKYPVGVGIRRWLPDALTVEDTLSGALVRGLEWLVALVFHGERAFAVTIVVIGFAVVVIETARARRRGRPLMNISPLVLPMWFAAELVAVSAPGNYYGAYYISFVPVWACLFAFLMDRMLPTAPAWSVLAMVQIGSCAVLLVGAVSVFDAAYRVDPTKWWWVFATNTRLPPPFIARLQDEAQRSDWQRYVPLLTHSPEVLIDMPLRPGTRFFAQYPYQFGGPDSPRAREFLADLSAADLIVEDRKRIRLNPALEARIKAIRESSFTPLFDWSVFQFYARRSPT